MCLTRVTKTEGFDPKREMMAYRVFDVENEYFLPCFQGVNSMVADKWWKEKDHRHPWDQGSHTIESHWEGRYPLGFHAFRRKQDAIKWAESWGMELDLERSCLARVKLRKIVAVGTQDETDVIVAKEMYIDKVYE